MSSGSQDIAIIGGGLAGPVLALCLKKRGINSTVYERRSADYHLGGDIVLFPNGNRVIDRLGIYSELCKSGFSFEKLALCNSSGSILGMMTNSKLEPSGIHALRIRRSTVRQVLLRELTDRGIPIVYGKQLERMDEGKTTMTLFFADGQTVEASIVVGADGVHSVVRKAINLPAEHKYTGVTNIYGMAKRDVFESKLGRKSELPRTCMMFGKEGSFMLQPTDTAATEMSYFGNIALPDRSKEEWDNFDANKSELQEILKKNFAGAHWNEEIKILIQESNLDLHRSWHIKQMPHAPKGISSSGRVILIGDAFHPLSPNAGQGGAMAFEDAETLAYILANGETDTQSLALQKWGDHRQNRVRNVQALDELSRKMKDAAPNWLLQVLKELFIRLLMKFKGPDGYKWLYAYDGEEAMRTL